MCGALIFDIVYTYLVLKPLREKLYAAGRVVKVTLGALVSCGVLLRCAQCVRCSCTSAAYTLSSHARLAWTMRYGRSASVMTRRSVVSSLARISSRTRGVSSDGPAASVDASCMGFGSTASVSSTDSS